MFKKIVCNPQAVAGLTIMLLVLLAAVLAPVLAPNDPEALNVVNKYLRPCAAYPLGTDQLGRCVLSRLLYGARYSIGMSLPALLILSMIGLILGSFSACAGKRADRVVTTICDIFIAFPALVIAAAIIGIWGNEHFNIVVAIVIAMALMVDAELIVADEPTTALDAEHRSEAVSKVLSAPEHPYTRALIEASRLSAPHWERSVLAC